MIREPVVAGQFYPSQAAALKKQIASFLGKTFKPKEAIACMLPHAGYIYSGKVASETVSSIEIKKRVVLLGPNHTGSGAAYSIMTEGTWRTPLGDIEIDSQLAKSILKDSDYLKEDTLAHLYEHSLEVELPLLQYFSSDFKIVPITLLGLDLVGLTSLAEEIALSIQNANLKDETLIVASSDMTHYESEDQAKSKDSEAIEAILSLDEKRLFKKVEDLNISMCGVAPAIVMLKAAKLLGAKAGELVKYMTSGDTTGDRSSVVGYAGIIIY